MTPTIDYFLTTTSPWTYLGHDLLVQTAKRHGAEIRWRPMQLASVFKETGGVPLKQRPPARQHYRFVELKRWRVIRALPLNLQPAHFPTDPALADRCAVALAEDGVDPAGFLARAFRAVWVHEQDIADEQTLEPLLADAGHEARDVIARARSEEIGAAYERNTREAVERDVFGAPTYILNGEPFWGQDRIDLLDAALESGRAPYLPE